jgi:drug/metabolite transporter (DMT)-like permease
MLAAALALGSSLVWGFSDFLGGLQSRRHALLAVMLVSQGTALALLVAALLAGAPSEHDGASTAWAALGGSLGLIGLLAFYHALSIGTMSIVAPISATGTLIPVLVGLAAGERPSAVQVAGMVLAAAGVVLAAREAPSADAAVRKANRTAVLLALTAAVGFGSFFAALDRAEQTGDVAWIMLAARTPDVVIILAACVIWRPAIPAARSLGTLAGIGMLDLLANLLFVLAAGRGLLSVVGVLSSLYPAVTVLLARVVLDERLTRVQGAGVTVTLCGVVALAAG